MASQQTFPAVPPSLSAGDHGMRDYYDKQDTQRPAPHSAPEITPYLGLRAQLSQIWINRWTVLLFLILVRVLIAIAGLHHDLDSAKIQALSACTSVESMGSAMASMPHYMSKGVNELTASGVDKAVAGLMSMLLMTITGVEELVVFYINMLTSTYLCLITLVVGGSLHVALKVAEDVTDFLNKTLGTIGSDIHKGIDGFQKDLNKFTGALNSIPKAFGGHGAIPKLDVDGSLDALDHLKLPDTIDQGLQKLNSSIPNFAEVQNFTNTALRLPFEEVKKLINQSLPHFHLNRSLFPVPQKEQLTFCSDDNGISDFFNHLASVANTARRAFIGVLVVLAILACIPMAYREIRRYRTMQKRAKLVGEKAYDPMDVVYITSRPYTASAGIKLATPFKDTKRQNLTRWVVAYGTSTPALLVLSLGITGLLGCLCQYILLKAVEKEVPALAGEIGDFAGKVVNTLNNASEAWAVGTNKAITSTNNDINHNIFGWVNTTTHAMNHTLNVFIDTTTKALNTTFGGTVLQDPVNELFNCLIGLKVASIEKGLTWVSDHAHIEFPLLANDTFSLGAAASLADDNGGSGKAASFLADPTSGATDEITKAVEKVGRHIADQIHTEALISTALLLLYLLVILMGVARAIFLAFRPTKVRGEGGPSYAGDIPLDNVDNHLTREREMPVEAAPAYEPTQPERPRRPFAAFNAPRQQDAGDDEMHWQDQKVGYAGARGQPNVQDASARRGSEFAVVEKY